MNRDQFTETDYYRESSASSYGPRLTLWPAPVVRHAGHGYFNDLLRLGVRIFEYQAAILHAKSLVAERFSTIVGSSNLDLYPIL